VPVPPVPPPTLIENPADVLDRGEAVGLEGAGAVAICRTLEGVTPGAGLSAFTMTLYKVAGDKRTNTAELKLELERCVESVATVVPFESVIVNV
jgi:hypothetical protein